MCKVYIDIGSKNYKVRIDEKESQQYIIMKKMGVSVNKETKEKEENWSDYKYPTTLNALVGMLTKILSTEELQKMYSDFDEASITMKDYLLLLDETEKRICNLVERY